MCDLNEDELYVIKRESPKKIGNVDMIASKLTVSPDLYGKKVDVVVISDFTDIYYRGKVTLKSSDSV